MNPVISRFVKRLQLPPNYRFELIKLTENQNPSLLKIFNSNKGSYPILELYHSSRFGEPANSSILLNGFRTSPFRNSHGFLTIPAGNKGHGIYLANHGKYAIWAGQPLTTIICHVIANTQSIKRYQSEIFSQKFNSEFVVTQSELVYPKYLIDFDLVCLGSNFDHHPIIRYTKSEEFNHSGEHCSSKYCVISRRCDCEQYPTVLQDDMVDILD